jgi:hypothetical protein
MSEVMRGPTLTSCCDLVQAWCIVRQRSEKTITGCAWPEGSSPRQVDCLHSRPYGWYTIEKTTKFTVCIL